MNEQTTKLISDLAAKLGTTAEHLWSVLIKQAPIASTVDLLCFVVMLISVPICAKWLIWSFKKCDDADYDVEIVYFIQAFIAGAIGIVSLLGILISLGGGMSLTIAGFFNPEYWALHEVMSHLK